jgi:predicted nucleic acid-binding protein
VKLYVDSSVLLRLVLAERGALREWRRATRVVSSELTRLECFRTIDRARARLGLPDAEVAARRSEVLAQLRAVELVDLDRRVLDRAAEAFPTSLGSLDAIHLASALLARTAISDLEFATHDDELGIAARAMGFGVVGVRTGA